ncbi:MAG: glycosyltransferase family 4 protein [Bacteroidaceae bacterium]|nr:glycosyltransferase family 4 protein [Bacteroidaceae bacterium]
MVKNVILVNDFAHIQGGADAVAITTAIALARKGIHVIFFSAVLPVDKKLLDAKIDVICLGKEDILHDKNRINAIVKGIYDKSVEKSFINLLHLYSNKDTIVHIHTWTKALSSAVFSVAGKMNFETVLTLHDFFTVCPNGGLFNYQKNELCRHKPMSCYCLLSNCDKRSYVQKQWRVIRQLAQNWNIGKIKKINLLAVSQKVANEVINYFPNRNVNIINLQNPVGNFYQDVFDIKPDSAYLFMGRLEDEKCPELFCEAITKLGLKGIVVGDGSLKTNLQNKYPNIQFSGWLSGQDKLEVIKTCKCLVFTSKLYETFGLVVAEMKALGIPSIVPKESAAAEQITDGFDGITFQIGNLDSLCMALERFEKMDLKEMLQNVRQSFDPTKNNEDTYVEHLMDIYESILMKRC